MVLDDVEVIAREVEQLSHDHDHVFTSGGVGPTHDDVTVEGVARAFLVPVVSSPELEQMLRDYYGDKLTDGHLLMARVPGGTTLTTGPKSPWPTVIKENVWLLSSQ